MLLLITIPLGVKVNHSAIIMPQNKKLIIKNAVVFFSRALIPLNLKLIRQISRDTASFIPKLRILFIGGKSMISEQQAPNNAPKISLN